MRGFFLLLLLTNVAFLAWQYVEQDSTAQMDPYRGIRFDDKGLTLLSELPADKRPPLRSGDNRAKVGATEGKEAEPVPQVEQSKAEAQPGKGMSEAAQVVCYRVDGIGERETLDSVLEQLKQRGAKGIEEGSRQGQRSNYWVMLPPYRNRDKASEAAAILKQQRIKDFFIVRSGEYENAVSLGVFSTRDRAERRYRQVDALKARLRKPKIEAIQLPAKRYWVTYELSDAKQKKSISDSLDALGLDKSKEISCK